nr:type II toxin-antitoxin system HipA family toxin [Oligoflexales bacterium]
FSLRYSQAYLNERSALAISKTLALQEQDYEWSSLHPFFDNLILEGWLLHQAEKILHIDKLDRFSLLMATGRYPIGAVSVVPLDPKGFEIPDPQDLLRKQEQQEAYKLSSPFAEFCPSCLLPSTDGFMHGPCAQNLWGSRRQVSIVLDKENPLASFSATIHGGSISGAQKKGLFYFDTKDSSLVPGPRNSTHILKPEGDFPELPANEHLTMAIAQSLKFKVPSFSLLKAEHLGLVYIIKRFDRTSSGALLKEDMAQLLQVPSESKYQGSMERVAKTLTKFTARLDLNDFFRRLLFCYVTGNGDMHLKNWAILEDQDRVGEMGLSPCYDLLNTRVALPSEKGDMALSFLGKHTKLKASYFRKFALKELGLNERYLDSIFAELPYWQSTIETMIPHSALSPLLKKNYLKICRERFNGLK